MGVVGQSNKSTVMTLLFSLFSLQPSLSSTSSVTSLSSGLVLGPVRTAAMQPPPRTGPPGASGPPPAGVGPNAFRRTRPHKHTGAAVMAGLPAQPMTDPFAFGRQAPPPMATGGHPPPPNSSPLPLQAPPPGMYHQAGMGQGLHQPQPLDSDSKLSPCASCFH